MYYNDGCEKCTLLPLLYRPACTSDSLRLANQEQVRGSCVSFESLGAVGSTCCRCVFLLRAWEPLDQVVRGSCVSFESLGGIGPGQCHGPGPMTPDIYNGIGHNELQYYLFLIMITEME